MKHSINLFLLLLISFNTISAKTIRYVKVDGTGDGTSWANASNSIQAMIDSSATGDDVWVAAGTYYPTTETIARDPRSKTFLLKTGVNLYGGFAGSESSVNQRVLSDLDCNGKIDSCELVNKTILSGNIDGIADVWTKTLNTDGKTWKWTVTGNEGNCYNVVKSSSKVDGFSVVGGNSTGYGGGIYAFSSTSNVTNCTVTNCSATRNGGGIYVDFSKVTNCIVSDCMATGNGGGIYFDFSSSSSIFTNCTVSNCFAAGDGGGIYVDFSSSFPSNVANFTISNCISNGNGAGIYAKSFPTSPSDVINCIISNCSAVSGSGGGIYAYYLSKVINCKVNNCSTISGGTGGGISAYYLSDVVNCTVTNCSTTGNGGGVFAFSNVTNCTVTNCSKARSGGGIYAESRSSSYPAEVTNCIVSNCSASVSGGGISVSYLSDVTNCASSNNKTGSIIGSGISITGTNCISPSITSVCIQPTTFIGVATTVAQEQELKNANWRLKEGSPCINAGSSTHVSSSILTGNDLDNNARVALGIIDIGAYEYVLPIISLPLKDDFNNLSDWNSSNVFYNSTKLNGGEDVKWSIANQKVQFNWQSNLTYYSQPFFTYQIDASNAAKIFLRYDMYFQAYAGTITPLGSEKLNVEYSTDLITWSNIATYTNANGTIANQTYKHDLSNILAGEKFFIRFNANGVNSNRIEKWEIDNVIIDADGVSAVNMAHEYKYKYVVGNTGLIISNLENGDRIELFDTNGKLLSTKSAESQNAQLTLPVRGVYLVKVSSDSGVENKKVVW